MSIQVCVYIYIYVCMLASNCLLNRDRFSPCSKYPFGCIGDDICVCFSMCVYRKKFCSNFNKYMGDTRYLLIREISLYYWIHRSKIIVFMICIFVWLYYYIDLNRLALTFRFNFPIKCVQKY